MYGGGHDLMNNIFESLLTDSTTQSIAVKFFRDNRISCVLIK